MEVTMKRNQKSLQDQLAGFVPNQSPKPKDKEHEKSKPKQKHKSTPKKKVDAKVSQPMTWHDKPKPFDHQKQTPQPTHSPQPTNKPAVKYKQSRLPGSGARHQQLFNAPPKPHASPSLNIKLSSNDIEDMANAIGQDTKKRDIQANHARFSPAPKHPKINGVKTATYASINVFNHAAPRTPPTKMELAKVFARTHKRNLVLAAAGIGMAAYAVPKMFSGKKKPKPE